MKFQRFRRKMYCPNSNSGAAESVTHPAIFLGSSELSFLFSARVDPGNLATYLLIHR